MKKSFLIVFIVLGNLWQLSAQIAADSIVGELKLLNNSEVKALLFKQHLKKYKILPNGNLMMRITKMNPKPPFG